MFQNLKRQYSKKYNELIVSKVDFHKGQLYNNTQSIPIRRPRRGPSSTEQSAVNNCWGRYVKSDFMDIWRVNPVLSS
jgi:hypothetical protein